MLTKYSLEFLQEYFGEDSVELNPHTGNIRFTLGTNDLWLYVEEAGGVAAVAKSMGLVELMIWKWIDDNYVPYSYLHDMKYLTGADEMTLQSPSRGYIDPETGSTWPWSWKIFIENADFNEELIDLRQRQNEERQVREVTC